MSYEEMIVWADALKRAANRSKRHHVALDTWAADLIQEFVRPGSLDDGRRM